VNTATYAADSAASAFVHLCRLVECIIDGTQSAQVKAELWAIWETAAMLSVAMRERSIAYGDADNLA
jgi:hypothetical protein